MNVSTVVLKPHSCGVSTTMLVMRDEWHRNGLSAVRAASRACKRHGSLPGERPGMNHRERRRVRGKRERWLEGWVVTDNVTDQAVVLYRHPKYGEVVVSAVDLQTYGEYGALRRTVRGKGFASMKKSSIEAWRNQYAPVTKPVRKQRKHVGRKKC